MAVADFTATYERSQAIDFSSSFFFETNGILVRESGSESKLWNMFLLFTIEVWLTIFGCAILSICFLHLLHKFSAIPYACKFNKFGSCVWFVISCLTNQGIIISNIDWVSKVTCSMKKQTIQVRKMRIMKVGPLKTLWHFGGYQYSLCCQRIAEGWWQS